MVDDDDDDEDDDNGDAGLWSGRPRGEIELIFFPLVYSSSSVLDFGCVLYEMRL